MCKNLSPKKILIIRTDRIGDVLLSTPVIKAVRKFYPDAYIAMMVRPYAREIVEGNPFLNDVIVYDKFGAQKSWLGSAKFARALASRKFDCAVILHPTSRVNLMTFFAGIPVRVGYNRKCGFLLTHKLRDTKHLGEKHESQYSLDVIRAIGIPVEDNEICMPLKKESEEWAEGFLASNSILPGDRVFALHPGASCPSKLWPLERFSELANRLINDLQAQIIIVSGPQDVALAQKVIGSISGPVIDLAGKTTISQLASIVKRCAVFISNDSGPVHIATAVGTSTISIFGRKQPGLSPKRWGPLGKKNCYVHKDVGCIECFAHNCQKEFVCLKSISVEDILEAIDEISKL
ncbi:lipopolysaccharide heptosyltransferase II [Candidatus Omnitrophota bacterium]